MSFLLLVRSNSKTTICSFTLHETDARGCRSSDITEQQAKRLERMVQDRNAKEEEDRVLDETKPKPGSKKPAYMSLRGQR